MKIRIKIHGEIHSFETDKEVTSIGRSSDNDIIIAIDDISRKHCLVTFKGGYAFILDLGSKNGVTVDGTRIKPHQHQIIYNNSKVMIANHFEFILPDGTSIKEKIDLEELIILESSLKNIK